MSGAEELDAARRALRKAAGAQLARREAAEAKVEKLTEAVERARSGRLDEAEVCELQGRLAEAQAEVDTHAHELSSSLNELKALEGLERSSERARLVSAARAAGSVHEAVPVSVEARALDNVRAEIASLEAQVGLNSELMGSSPEPDPEPVDPEARARAELERLKAERRAGPAESKGKKPKKTM